MKAWFAALTMVVFLVPCTSSSAGGDPYPGSGGLYMGTPSQADISSGRSVFDESKFSSFREGLTTKQQVVEALGEPANWTTEPDGSSQLGYNYLQKETGMFLHIKEARFIFDSKLVLTEMRLPQY